MRPPAPAARDTPTSRTGTPPAAGALPGEARPERSPTRGKAAPPFGAPDAQPGALTDAQPGTGPDAGADAKPSAPPPAPRKEAVRRAGASPPQRLPPVGILPMDIPPASARPQGPHPAGFRPAKRFRRKRRPRPELRARQTGKPRPRHSPPIPDRVARARAPSPLPPLFLLLFLIGHTLRKGFPEGYGQGFGGSPGKISGTAGGNAGRGPAQHAGERLGERTAEPLPKRPDGLTRALQHGPLQRGFRQVPEGPHPRTHNIGRFRHVVAEEVREPYERGLGVLLGDAEREDFPERLPEHLFGPPELTGEAGGVRPDRAERGHVRVRQQEQQRELALVGKLADFGVVPDARRYLTVFHHLSSRMASGAALPSPLNLKCSFNFSAPLPRAMKRRRSGNGAPMMPASPLIGPGKGCRAPGHSLGPVHESAPYPMYGMDNSIYENKWQQKNATWESSHI